MANIQHDETKDLNDCTIPQDRPPPPLGFRLDYLPMSYEVSPLASDFPEPQPMPPLPEFHQVKSYVTRMIFDAGKPRNSTQNSVRADKKLINFLNQTRNRLGGGWLNTFLLTNTESIFSNFLILSK